MLTTGDVMALAGVPQRTLANWEHSLGLKPSVRRSRKKGLGGHRWTMRDAEAVAIAKSLRDRGVPPLQVRQAVALIQGADREQLEGARICMLDDKLAQARDVIRLGCKALGIRYTKDLLEKADADLADRIVAAGEPLLELDPVKHFTWTLVPEGEPLPDDAVVIANLQQHLEAVRKRARAMGLEAQN